MLLLGITLTAEDNIQAPVQTGSGLIPTNPFPSEHIEDEGKLVLRGVIQEWVPGSPAGTPGALASLEGSLTSGKFWEATVPAASHPNEVKSPVLCTKNTSSFHVQAGRADCCGAARHLP